MSAETLPFAVKRALTVWRATAESQRNKFEEVAGPAPQDMHLEGPEAPLSRVPLGGP